MLVEGACDQLLESHRHIDFNINGQIPYGVTLIEREDDRARVISDSPDGYVQSLRESGATQIRVQPLSLQELFIGLVGKA